MQAMQVKNRDTSTQKNVQNCGENFSIRTVLLDVVIGAPRMRKVIEAKKTKEKRN